MTIREEILKEPVIIDRRTVGNSTRQIDHYIQVLFIEGSVNIKDHAFKINKNMNRWLLNKVMDRLLAEHSYNNTFKVNDLTITVKSRNL